MDSRGPTTTARAGAPTTVGASRLAQMQMRFQQRQQQERDQRKIEQIATRTTTTTAAASTIASSHGGRTATSTTATTTTSSSAVSATVELSERLAATSLSSTLGAGKVRQMFDERRHRVAGIDKSYPLQPIQATSTVPAHGNHSVNGNNNISSNSSSNNNHSSNNSSIGNDGGGSLPRGMGKTGMNNKPRVPPISAGSRTRLMQQQTQTRGSNLRQDSVVGMQATNRSNFADGGALLMDTDAGFDDNDNFLEQEKFPDATSLEEDSLDSADRMNSINGNVVSTKPARSNGAAASRTLAGHTLQKATKKSPMTASNSITSTSSVASTVRSPSGSAKSGTASPRATASLRSNGSSRAVTQPSPASSAGSVRRASAASNGGGMLAKTNEPVPDGLTRCDICSRNFATDRIDKHRQICQKTNTKKRKIFDITKHRVQGTDAENYVLKGKKSTAGAASVARKQSSQLSSVGANAAAANKQSGWRKKHEEFIAAIRAAKEMKAHLARGGKLSDLPPPPPSENPDYIQCPHCSRRFNQTAAERHIPKCATMLHNKPKPKPKAGSTVRRY
uniref:C2HC/C3H-type domain-containing protein n=1 Tax=Anopheles dirus TaxID=7168 RepID=A0A182NG61_9DIPT